MLYICQSPLQFLLYSALGCRVGKRGKKCRDAHHNRLITLGNIAHQLAAFLLTGDAKAGIYLLCCQFAGGSGSTLVQQTQTVTQSAVGGPWITRNEARADNNLPPIEGGDRHILRGEYYDGATGTKIVEIGDSKDEE